MKKFMITSALVAAFPLAAVAQSEMTTANVPAFRSSDFIGMSVHAIDNPEVRALNDQRMATEDYYARSEMGWMSGDILGASRSDWDDIGDVEDIVLTQDGDVRGVIVDIGGFLGIGAHTVLLDFADLYMVPDDGNAEVFSQYLVVTTFSEEQLESMPQWDPAALTLGFTPRDWRMSSMNSAEMNEGLGAEPVETETATAVIIDPVEQTDGMDTANAENMPEHLTDMDQNYMAVDMATLSADKILGANIYDASGQSVGSVTDLVLDGEDSISAAVVDIGGFLGIGARTVALPIDEAKFQVNEMGENLRIDTVMTREQIEGLPEYTN